MQIRPYEAPDESAVIELWRECGLLRWSDPKKDIARKLQVNPEWFLVGEIDGKVMATCMIGYEGHRAWVNFLGVAEKYRGGGHAKALLAETERLMRGIGCAKINLQVRSTNQAVVAFYQNLGYATEDLINMGKRLEKD